MLQVDGFHGVLLSLCTELSHFWIPPRQQLAHSLSVANGFLIESPQVVYLFVKVKLEWCGQDTDLHHTVGFFLFVCFFVISQWTAGTIVLSLSPSVCPAHRAVMLFNSNIYLSAETIKKKIPHHDRYCMYLLLYNVLIQSDIRYFGLCKQVLASRFIAL